MIEIYTPAIKAVPYLEQLDICNFERPPEGYIYVNQDHGKISQNGQPLASEGFSSCSGLVLRNSRTLESALFHLEGIDMSDNQRPIAAQFVINYMMGQGLDEREKQELILLIHAASRDWNKISSDMREYPRQVRENLKSRMKQLNQDNPIKACFVRGEESLDRKNRISEFLDYFGITSIEDILIETERSHWHMAYKPKESMILVNSKSQRKILSFPF